MTLEEKQELLQIAKENGTQAVPILITIVEDIIPPFDDSKQELLQIAKENGTQAVPILITIVEDIIPPFVESKQELLQIAKENGTQAVSILTEIIEKLLENPFTFKIDDKEVEDGQLINLLPGTTSLDVKLEVKNAALLDSITGCSVKTSMAGRPDSTSSYSLTKRDGAVQFTIMVDMSITIKRFVYKSNNEIVFAIEIRTAPIDD